MHTQTEEDGQQEKTGKGEKEAEGKAGEEGSEEKKRISGQDRRDKAEWRGQDRDAYRIRLLF